MYIYSRRLGLAYTRLPRVCANYLRISHAKELVVPQY